MINGKTPLIHVGYPKALSSWMQKFLFVPQNGFCKVLDPLTVQLFLIDSTPFAFTTEKANEWIDKTLKETDGSNDLMPVITSESLVGHTHCGGFNAKQNADRLHQLTQDAKILIVIREQQSEIRSLYKTFVIWGMPHSIDRILNPVDPNLSPQFNLDFLRYDLLVAYYQQLFGKENVLVLPYEKFSLDSTQYLRSIVDFSGQTVGEDVLNKLPVGRTVNRNQTMFNLHIQRLKNRFLLSNPFNYSGLFPSSEKNLDLRIKRSKKNPYPAFMDNWFEEGFSNKVKQHCAGQFSDSNKRLQELTGLELEQYGYEV